MTAWQHTQNISFKHGKKKKTWMFSLLQLLSGVRLCDLMNYSTPAFLSITNSWSSPKLMSIESVMSSSHLILCRPLLLLPPIPPSIRVFSNESTLCMRWPKYWSFSFSISPLMAPHSSTLAWKIPWMEEPGRL